MDLQSKTDAALQADLINLRTSEKEVLLDILLHLQEVERRTLELRSGLSSMYVYCMEILGYSKDEAYLRIQALRLMKSVPEVQEKIKSGSVGLTVLSKAQTAFHQEDCKRKAAKAPALTNVEKSIFVASLENLSTRHCERRIAANFPDQPASEKTKAISRERTLIQFSVDQELLSKLEVLKNLMSHVNYDRSWEGLFAELTELGLKKYRKSHGPEVCEMLINHQQEQLRMC